MKDIMIDLETLSTSTSAAVIAVGACKFDIATGEIGELFHMKVDFDEAVEKGTVDGSTIRWWLKQSEAARKELLEGPTFPLNMVLYKLRYFIGEEENKVWGNGATFDISILEHHYEASGCPVPWAFWEIQDVRTLMRVAKDKTNMDFKKHTEFAGTAHNALSDAIHQAKYVSAAYQALAATDQTCHVEEGTTGDVGN